MTAIDPATNGHDDLTSEVIAYVAKCCTCMNPIHGTFFESVGEVNKDGTFDVEVRRIGFAVEDLAIRVTFRPIKLVIVPSGDDKQQELPAESSTLGLPVSGGSS